MADTDNEIRGLVREHEDIWLQMKFLTDSLIGLSTKSTPVKDLIWSYRWNLLDFQEIAQKHIELDERIFKTIPGNHIMEHITKEHEEIRKQIENAILLVNIAVENDAEQGKLEQHALNIRDKVDSLCDLIKAHTVKEDELLKRMQQEL